jgi:hypothetical protein
VVGNYSFATRGDTLQMFDLKENKVVWEQKIEGDIARIGGHLASPPAVVNGRSVIGTVNGEITCFDNATGKQEWSCKIDQAIRFQPAVMNGRIYAGTTNGQLVCVNTGNKELTGWSMWGGDAAHNGSITTPALKDENPQIPPKIAVPLPTPATQVAQTSIPHTTITIWIMTGICVLLILAITFYLLIRHKSVAGK